MDKKVIHLVKLESESPPPIVFPIQELLLQMSVAASEQGASGAVVILVNRKDDTFSFNFDHTGLKGIELIGLLEMIKGLAIRTQSV